MDRLRALQKQARWGDPELSSLRDVDALSAQRLIQALARHLLPLAEALERTSQTVVIEQDREAARKALKNLQEALE